MSKFFIALALLAAACSPPAAPAPAQTSEQTSAEVKNTSEPQDLGPYTNNWDSNEFSRFTHTLHAVAPGVRSITLAAQTNSPGGETVAVYPVKADGERGSPRIMFVIADQDGQDGTAELEFPASGAGVPVMVVVENAGGRRHAGSYTLTVAP
jgi:hypothetical protein